MNIFESLTRHARHPLLRDILVLITRDESRHMGFGILYVSEWMKRQAFEQRVAFAQRWLGQILFAVTDQPGPILLGRLVRRLREAGVADVEEIAPQLLKEQQAVNAADMEKIVSGQRVPHLLKSARRAGMLDPEILAALGLDENPVVRAALRPGADGQEG
jgi:hypothetical protein